MKKLINYIKKPISISLLIAFGVSIILIFLFSYLGKFQGIELASIDWRFSIRGEKEPSDDIVIITLDDITLQEFNTTYQEWKRIYHAKLIKNLKDYGAKVIGLDIIFSEESQNKKDDEELAQAFRYANNVVIDANFEIVREKYYSYERLNFPLEIFQDTATVGIVNLLPDPDGFVRRVLLYRERENKIYYSTIIKILQKYLNAKDKDIKLGNNFIKIKNHYIPTDKYHQLLINYRGDKQTFKCIPYWQVYKEKVAEKFIKDKIALVGIFTDTIAYDVHPIPYSRLTGIKMPGIEIIANTIDTILTSDYLYELNIFLNSIILIFVTSLTAVFTHRLSLIKATAATLIFIIIFLIITVTLFIVNNLIIHTITPLIGIFLTYAGVVLYRGLTEEREKSKIRKVFSRYVSADVVNEILDASDISLGGKRKEVTILFSDIRGFTPMAEKMKPEDVVTILNEYFTEWTDIVFNHKGTVDKFMGDAIMAIFGAPISHGNDAEAAVNAALEMKERLKRLKDKWQQEEKVAFDIGIGINTGEVVVGNIGSPQRMEYTVIGDNVNLASRLEALTRVYDATILISEYTYNKIKDKFNCRKIEEVTVKGKTEKVWIYEVVNRKTEEPKN